MIEDGSGSSSYDEADHNVQARMVAMSHLLRSDGSPAGECSMVIQGANGRRYSFVFGINQLLLIANRSLNALAVANLPPEERLKVLDGSVWSLHPDEGGKSGGSKRKPK